jgi:hypothetical protein
MPVTSLMFRMEQRKYLEGLLHRVRMVECSVCGAKKREPCVSRQGRSGKWCHGDRHNEAKRVGLLAGRWFNKKEWGKL